MHSTPDRSPRRPPVTAVVIGTDTRNALLVGLAAWAATALAAWATFRGLGFQGHLVDPASSFNLALGFAGGGAGLLLFGAARTFFHADQAWPTLAALLLYALPLVAAVAVPYAILGPGRLDLEAATAVALETAPLVLVVFAVLATPTVRHAVGALAHATADRVAGRRAAA